MKFYRWKRRISKLPESERNPATYQEAMTYQKRIFGQKLPYLSLQVPIKMSVVKIVSSKFIEFAHFVGISIQVWTINDPKVMEMLLRWNVDGIFTDKPRDLLNVWEKFQDKGKN